MQHTRRTTSLRSGGSSASLEIRRISVDGFRSIRHVRDLEFGRTNVIVGASGSGKSNFLKLLSFLGYIRRQRLRYYVQIAGGADAILRFGQAQTPELETAIVFRHGELHGSYLLRLSAVTGNFLKPTVEKVGPVGNMETISDPQMPANHFEAKIAERQIATAHPDIVASLQKLLDSLRIYNFHNAGPRSPLNVNPEITNNRSLLPNGDNLAAFLHLLKHDYADAFHRIRNSVQEIAPHFEDFVLEPTESAKQTVRMMWKHVEHEHILDVSAMSDGVLRFVALTTLLQQPDRFLPTIVLLEEPELGLHPSAQCRLAEMVKQVAKTRQVIISTQSPVLLDEFTPDDVLLAHRPTGATELVRLHTEQFRQQPNNLRLGQMWQTHGLEEYARQEC